MPDTLPPLVNIGPELTVTQRQRHARHLLLPGLGSDGQRRITNARVLIIGAGGLGSPALLYLAAAGVGTLGVIDDDVVELSNLQRQVIHRASSVGESKVDSAAAAVADLDPEISVETHPVRLTPENAVELFSRYDLILDGADNFATRYLVSDAAEIAGKPVVWGSLLQYAGQVSVFWGSHGPTYRDVFPDPPQPGTVPSCAEGGVLGVVCGAVGSMMGIEAVKLITGLGRTLLGRLLVFDALAASWRELKVAADPSRQPVTTIEAAAELCAAPTTDTDDAAVPSVSPYELRKLLESRADGAESFRLIDVREPDEAADVSIDGAELIPQGRFFDNDVELDPGEPVILHCRSGARSAAVLNHLRDRGQANVRHLDGGIVAWLQHAGE